MQVEIVAGLIIQANKILLGHRSPTRLAYPNVWDVFGGHMEPGEDQSQTLVRELQEELGITPSQYSYSHTLTIAASESQKESSAPVLCHFYLVTDWSGTPTNLQLHEHTSIGWFSLSEAVELDLADPSFPELFAQFLEG